MKYSSCDRKKIAGGGRMHGVYLACSVNQLSVEFLTSIVNHLLKCW